MRVDNQVVLRGRLTSAPKVRSLPSGSVLVQLEITTPASDEASSSARSAPVVWFDPPTRSGLGADTPVGTELVVVGHVRRRYFRAAGTTQSRTEVVAEMVVRASRRREVERALARAADALVAPVA
ncbi:MAG: single-stranded DNA-binding protein [Ilumatobacteraceae bacterium]